MRRKSAYITGADAPDASKTSASALQRRKQSNPVSLDLSPPAPNRRKSVCIGGADASADTSNSSASALHRRKQSNPASLDLSPPALNRRKSMNPAAMEPQPVLAVVDLSSSASVYGALPPLGPEGDKIGEFQWTQVPRPDSAASLSVCFLFC